MLRYNKYSRIFLAPPNDPTGGSGPSGNPAANQGGGTESSQGSGTVDPFAGLDLDDLDPAARAVIEKVKTEVASLQKKAADEAAGRIVEEKQKREFQSKFDQLQVQVSKLTGGNGQTVSPADQAKAQHLEKFTQILVGKGVAEPQAKVQAELMLDMMTEFGTSLKGEIGRDLAPFAGSVVQREAESAWANATQNDPVGTLQIPAVAEQAWAQVQILVQQGQQVTPETIKNLAGMAYLQHLEKGGKTNESVQQQPPQQQQQLPNIGRTTYPGAGAAPFRPPISNPNAPKHILDPDTDRALQSVMSRWDVKPKAFRKN